VPLSFTTRFPSESCECDVTSDECSNCNTGTYYYSGTCFDSEIIINDLAGTMTGDKELILKNEKGQELNLIKYQE
jgi:hypothetical protein